MLLQVLLSKFPNLCLEHEMAPQAAFYGQRVPPALTKPADEDRLVGRLLAVQGLPVCLLVEGEVLGLFHPVAGTQRIESLDVQVEYVIQLDDVVELFDGGFSAGQLGDVEYGSEAEDLVTEAPTVGETPREADVSRDIVRAAGDLLSGQRGRARGRG